MWVGTETPGPEGGAASYSSAISRGLPPPRGFSHAGHHSSRHPSPDSDEAANRGDLKPSIYPQRIDPSSKYDESQGQGSTPSPPE